jgi:hypothetical protein
VTHLHTHSDNSQSGDGSERTGTRAVCDRRRTTSYRSVRSRVCIAQHSKVCRKGLGNSARMNSTKNMCVGTMVGADGMGKKKERDDGKMHVRRQLAQPPTRTQRNTGMHCRARTVIAQERCDCVCKTSHDCEQERLDTTQPATAGKDCCTDTHASTTAVSTRHHRSAAAHGRCTKHGMLRAGN